MTAAEKASMMGMLKLLSSKIETAKEEVGQAVALATKPGGVAELQKELLDAELELMQVRMSSVIREFECSRIFEFSSTTF